jgi:hypothetical protein
VCCLSLVGPRICWLVNGTRDIPVEALPPEGRERFKLGSSRSSRVLGIDAVGSPPHCNFANEFGRELWDAPVKDGGHVACCVQVASAGGCQQVAERMFTGFGREAEQVGSQGLAKPARR